MTVLRIYRCREGSPYFELFHPKNGYCKNYSILKINFEKLDGDKNEVSGVLESRNCVFYSN